MQQLSTNVSSSSNPNCNNYPGPKYNTVDIYFWMKNKNDKWRPNNNWLLPQNYSKLFIFYMSHHIILVWNIKNILAGIITDNIGQKNAYTSNISYNYNVNQAGWYSLAAENTPNYMCDTKPVYSSTNKSIPGHVPHSTKENNRS